MGRSSTVRGPTHAMPRHHGHAHPCGHFSCARAEVRATLPHAGPHLPRSGRQAMTPIQQWHATRRLRLLLQTLRDMMVSMGPLLLLGGGLLVAAYWWLDPQP